MKLGTAAKMFKNGLKLLVAFVAVYYLAMWVLLPAARTGIKKLFPPKDLPTVSFGKLPQLKFTNKPVLGTPKYVLNTKTGKLPTNLPNKVPVYRFIPPQFSYMDGKLAKSSANYLGFTDNDLTTDLKGDIYKWKNVTTGSTLEIRIKTKEMSLQTPLADRAPLFTKGNLTYSWALESAKSMLKATARFSDSFYASGYQTVKLGKYVGSTLAESIDPKDAQIAQVNFFRSIEKYPIYGPSPKRGLLYVLIAAPTSGTGPLRFPVVEAYYWELESKSTATYPLIPVATAWKSISEGNGIIVNATPKNNNPFEDYQPVRAENILINDIYLAYYETPEFQKYLQPIYVFQGNYTTVGTQGGDVTIYFPAVSGEYVQ